MTASNTPLSFGPYTVGQTIREDRFGRVARATDSRDGTAVTLRILGGAADAGGVLFNERARAAQSLRSPYTAHIDAFGQEGGADYLVSEAVDGDSLADAIARGPLPATDAFRIAGKVARALEEAEARGVVHGNLSANAVVLTKASGVKVADFGLPRCFAETPETAAGQPATTSTDIYAVAALVFAMLSGHSSLSEDSIDESIPALPPQAVTALLKCLSPDPDERVSSASTLAGILEHTAHLLAPSLDKVKVEVIRKGSKATGTTYAVSITNRDDVAVTLQVQANDDDGESTFVLPTFVTVPAAETVIVPLGITTKKRRWRGLRKARPFTLMVALPALELLFPECAGGTVVAATAAAGSGAAAGAAASAANGGAPTVAQAGNAHFAAVQPQTQVMNANWTASVKPTQLHANGHWSGPSPVQVRGEFANAPLGMAPVAAGGIAAAALVAGVVLPITVFAGGGDSKADDFIEPTPTPTQLVIAQPTPSATFTVVATNTPAASVTPAPSASATASPTVEAPVITNPDLPATPAVQTPAPAATAVPTAAPTQPPTPVPTPDTVAVDKAFVRQYCQAYSDFWAKLSQIGQGVDGKTAGDAAITALITGLRAAKPAPDAAAFWASFMGQMEGAVADYFAGQEWQGSDVPFVDPGPEILGRLRAVAGQDSVCNALPYGTPFGG